MRASLFFRHLFCLVVPLLVTAQESLVEHIGITVNDQTRQFCYTNKEAGTYYGEVNSPNRGGWQGWFINATKIMDDYSVSILDRSTASSLVFPHVLIRSYRNGAQEEFVMADSINALLVFLSFPEPIRFECRISMRIPAEYQEARIALDSTLIFGRDPKRPFPVATPGWIGITVTGGNIKENTLIVPPGTQRIGITIAAGNTILETQNILDQSHGAIERTKIARRDRMDRILSRSMITTDDRDFNIALQWARLSMDALIMNQSVSGVPTKGIFAGLPWFNNYWGRDSFISLAGATYVTGDLDGARSILRSFARFQELDTLSSNYGRIPNLATPTSVMYNTADGTPRFVIALYEYYQYSNDTSFVKELFPVVNRSIAGTLRYHIDSLFFLTHGDAESWMDAVGLNGAWTPRGNRACDVQALWYNQLVIGSRIAEMVGDTSSAKHWLSIGTTLRTNFNRIFVNRDDRLIYDHINADGTPSRELRPNQLFSLDLLDSGDIRENVIQTVTANLAYEYGVGTLDRTDTNFHPFHHYEPYYVQDAAYHTGIVWTWLNGVTISALTQFGQSDLAMQLTRNMVHQILHRGCVGTLSELLDAIPRPGEKEPRLSGTFSQAWSLAEFIRTIYQDYLGMRIDLPYGTLAFRPSVPSILKQMSLQHDIGAETIRIEIQSSNDSIHVLSQGDYTIKRDAVQQGDRIPLLQLAQITFDPSIPALRGPSYPLLELAKVRRENAKAIKFCYIKDPIHDDRGATGTYQYPKNPNFIAGILDITSARISYDDSSWYFALQFRNLNNPGWHPEYGFQLTYAAIAIHRGSQKNASMIGLNSQYLLPRGYEYDRLILVGGGIGVRDENNNVLCEYLPRAEDAANPIGDPVTKTVRFSLPRHLLGTPTKKWKMIILIGGQDDHGGAGIGEFRSVEQNASEWTGGGKPKQDLPNIYDDLIIKP